MQSKLIVIVSLQTRNQQFWPIHKDCISLKLTKICHISLLAKSYKCLVLFFNIISYSFWLRKIQINREADNLKSSEIDSCKLKENKDVIFTLYFVYVLWILLGNYTLLFFFLSFTWHEELRLLFWFKNVIIDPINNSVLNFIWKVNS